MNFKVSKEGLKEKPKRSFGLKRLTKEQTTSSKPLKERLPEPTVYNDEPEEDLPSWLI